MSSGLSRLLRVASGSPLNSLSEFPVRFPLGRKLLAVGIPSLCVYDGAFCVIDKTECSSGPIAGIGIGAVDDQTVVDDEIPGLDDHRHLGGKIFIAEIRDTL